MKQYGVRFLIYFLFLFSLAADAFAIYSSDANTVAIWHFDEGAGNYVFDATNNSNTGYLVNVYWTTDSISGHALRFNGVDAKVSVIKTTSVDLVSQVSLEAWIKRESNTDGMIISKNGPWFLAVRNNVTEGGIYTSDGIWIHVSGLTPLQINKWYHLALTYDGSQIKLYVDGNLENMAPKTGQMPVVSQVVNLGWGEPGHNQYYKGIMDEVRISDIARTSFNVTLPDTYCGDGVVQRLNSRGQFEDCDDVAGSYCINCLAYGTPGGWLGCRGSGVRVCEVLLRNASAYFAANPLCIPIYCDGPGLACNDNYCPREGELPPTPPTIVLQLVYNLTNRVNNLDLQVLDLEERLEEQQQTISLLEGQLDILNNVVDLLSNTVDNIITNLFGLPRGLRQDMICYTMRATNQTNSTAFGLSCTIDEKGICNCV